ncbi:tRNA pseudouridine(38-40) synthase TruA [Ichthyobacterium seriolicida]|nr:tRNA pseudouridine(38-40) synthase TruA [Ichthyobacterium seriolicida]
MRYFIEISYCGYDYCGWQIQPEQYTIQGIIEDRISKILGKQINIVGASRTDSGVHAKQTFAHFDTDIIENIDKLVFKLNMFLPKDISIRNIFQVNADSHARFDATSRTYKYYISTVKNSFTYNYTYQIYNFLLDIEKMNESCKVLLDYTDFKCFSKSNTDVFTYNCDITLAHWEKKEDLLIFTIRSNRFLRNMVRAIVGTMMEISRDKITIDDLKNIIENSSNVSYSVPARGLYLTEIDYPKEIFKRNTIA